MAFAEIRIWVERMLKYLVLKDKIAGFTESGDNFIVTFLGSHTEGEKLSNTKAELINVDKIMKKHALFASIGPIARPYNEALYRRVVKNDKNIININTIMFGNFTKIDEILNGALREHRMVAWARRPAADGKSLDFFFKLTDDDVGIMPNRDEAGVTYNDAVNW